MNERTRVDVPSDEPKSPRFDAAHSTSVQMADHGGGLAASTADMLAAISGNGPGTHDQLQTHATQLAEHLRDRQTRLARQKATLNARSAEYDDQQRSARLWLREQQNELENHAAELARRVRELEKREVEFQDAGRAVRALEREHGQIAQTRKALEEQKQQLDTELENVRHQAEWLEAARNSWQQQCREEQRTLNELREQLLDQRQATEDLNARLQSQLAQARQESLQKDRLVQWQRQVEIEAAQNQKQAAALEDERQILTRDQELSQSRIAQQRQTVAALWRRRRQTLHRLRESLDRRRKTLDAREEALDKRQEDIDRQRQEIAQDQLVVQQARTVLLDQLAPQEFCHIEQSVQRYIQSKLAATETTTSLHKRELHKLARSLQQQQELLKTRHARLHAQICRRQRELDARAAQLAKREQTLQHRECLARE